MVETFSRGEMFCLYLSGTFCSQFSQKEELTLEGMLVHLCPVSWCGWVDLVSWAHPQYLCCSEQLGASNMLLAASLPQTSSLKSL